MGTDRISKHDAEHARRGRDAMMSAGLNTAEGQQQRGGHGRQRFQTAMGSADEVTAVLELAGAAGYVEEQPQLVAEWRGVARTLYRLMTKWGEGGRSVRRRQASPQGRGFGYGYGDSYGTATLRRQLRRLLRLRRRLPLRRLIPPCGVGVGRAIPSVGPDGSEI